MSKEKLLLTTPLKVNGVDLTELEYDYSEININDLAEIENERNKAIGKNPALNTKIAQNDFFYHIFIGMMAIIKCNPQISFEDLKRIKGYDLTRISMIGMRFFVPPDFQEQKSSEEPQEVIQESSTVQ